MKPRQSTEQERRRDQSLWQSMVIDHKYFIIDWSTAGKKRDWDSIDSDGEEYIKFEVKRPKLKKLTSLSDFSFPPLLLIQKTKRGK